MRIELTARFRRHVRSLPPSQRRKIGAAIDDAQDAWGKPHLHGGIGLRRLRGDFFECRSGLTTRLVFESGGDELLLFHLLGNHDEVRRFIKSLK